MKYFAGVNLEYISLSSSARYLKKVSKAFIRNYEQQSSPNIFIAVNSNIVVSNLKNYLKVINISPLYIDPDRSYYLSEKFFSTACKTYLAIRKTKNSTPDIMAIKIAFCLDILLFLQDKIGRNRLTDLYVLVENDFLSTLASLKEIIEEVKQPKLKSWIFSGCARIEPENKEREHQQFRFHS